MESGAPRPLGLATLSTDLATVLAGRLVSIVLSLATVPLLARLLGATAYGQLAYVTVIATLIFVAGSVWTSASVLRYGREAVDTSGLMHHVTWERLLLTAPALAIAVCVACVLKVVGWMPEALSWSLVGAAAAYGLVLAVSDHAVYLLQAAGMMSVSALVVVLRQLLALVVVGVLALVGIHLTAGLIIVVILLGTLVTAIGTTPKLWRVALWPPSWNAQLRRRMLRFSVPLLAFTASQYVISTIDLLVLGVYRSTADVGRYAVAYQAYSSLQNLSSAFTSVLTPLFVSLTSAGRGTTIETYVRRAVPQLTFLGGTVLGACAPVAARLVPVVFGHDFRGATVPLVVLLIPATFLITANLQAPVILLHEKTRGVGRVNLVAAAANVIGDFVLIGRLGLGGAGAAIATALAALVVVVGYSRILPPTAAARLGLRDAILIAPLLLGVLGGALATRWAFSAGIAVGVLVVAVLVVASGVVFERGDEQLLDHLRLPPAMRMALGRIIRLAPES